VRNQNDWNGHPVGDQIAGGHRPKIFGNVSQPVAEATAHYRLAERIKELLDYPALFPCLKNAKILSACSLVGSP
jgi:hypothetical protein